MDNTEFLRTISTEDLALLGAGDVVYVRPVTVDEKAAFALNRADGRPVAVVADYETALAVALQNELMPMSVH